MIFVTLGSQKFQFNRLLETLDSIVENGLIEEKVFAQIGYSDYEPHELEFTRFLNRDEFNECMTNADIVITHGGTGAIISAVKKGKKVIAVPRLAKYGEHVDDHQIQIITQFSDMNLIIDCLDTKDLAEKISIVRNRDFLTYESNTWRILEDIKEYIENV